MKHIKIIPVLLSVFLSGFCSAQSLTPQVIASQGDYFSSASGSLSWTLGESMTETYSSTNNKLTQGFQQPHFFNMLSVQNHSQEKNILLFPNPATDKVNLQFKNVPFGNYTIELFDMQGRKVSSENYSLHKGAFAQYVFSLQNVTSGIYLLNISSAENNFKQSFRLNKAEE